MSECWLLPAVSQIASCQVQSEMEKMNGQSSKIADRNLLFAEEVSSKHPPCRQSGQTFETHTRSQTGRGKDRFGSGAYSVLSTKHEKDQSGRDGYFSSMGRFQSERNDGTDWSRKPGILIPTVWFSQVKVFMPPCHCHCHCHCHCRF